MDLVRWDETVRRRQCFDAIAGPELDGITIFEKLKYMHADILKYPLEHSDISLADPQDSRFALWVREGFLTQNSLIERLVSVQFHVNAMNFVAISS